MHGGRARAHGGQCRLPVGALNTYRSALKVHVSAPKAPEVGLGAGMGSDGGGWKAGDGGTPPPPRGVDSEIRNFYGLWP